MRQPNATGYRLPAAGPLTVSRKGLARMQPNEAKGVVVGRRRPTTDPWVAEEGAVRVVCGGAGA